MKVSVLMAVHGAERPEYLHSCLASLKEQTQPADQIVLVKDGALTPELTRVIDAFRSSLPLKIVELPQREGLGAALSVGLKHCDGKWVARMDSDDVCVATRLELQLARAEEEPHVDILGSYVIEIDTAGAMGRMRKVPTTHDRIFAALWACPILHPTVLFRRNAIVQLGGYNPKLRRRQDYELWFRSAAEGLVFENISQPLLLYRFSDETHKKQSVRLAFQQAIIGIRGTRRLRMSWWKQLACFTPLLRSAFPLRVQRHLYKWLSRFDPRYRSA